MDLATLTGQLRALRDEALPRIAGAPDVAALDELDVAYLGRKGGALSGLMRGIGQLPPEDRPRVGVVVNEVRAESVTEHEPGPGDACEERQERVVDREREVPDLVVRDPPGEEPGQRGGEDEVR